MILTMEDFNKVVQQMLPDKEFNAEMDANLAFLKSYFKTNPTKGFMPMLILHTNRNHRIAMAVADVPSEAEQRHKMMHDILFRVAKDEKLRKEHGLVIAIFFMSEAWMRGQTEKGEKIKLPIADQPTKTEVIITSGITIDKRVNMAMYPMLRGDNGIVVLDEKHAIITPYVRGAKEKQTVSYLLNSAFAGYVEGMQA